MTLPCRLKTTRALEQNQSFELPYWRCISIVTHHIACRDLVCSLSVAVYHRQVRVLQYLHTGNDFVIMLWFGSLSNRVPFLPSTNAAETFEAVTSTVQSYRHGKPCKALASVQLFNPMLPIVCRLIAYRT